MIPRVEVRTRRLLGVLLIVALSACSKPTPEQSVAAAQRHIAENDLGAAQIELRNAIQAAPNHAQAHRLLATVYLRRGEPEAAEVMLRKALTLGEKPDVVLPELALVMLHVGPPQRVIDEFASTSLQDPVANASLRATLGHAWLLRGDAKAGAEAFAAALSSQPGNASATLGQARIAAHEGRAEDAMALTDAALKSDPKLVEAYAFKSQLLMARDQQQPAKEALEKALAIDGNYVPARLALASMLIGAKDYEKAKAVIGAAGPATKDPRVKFLGALVALRQNDLPKARDTVAAVLRIAPDYDVALALAGEIELVSGNFALAEQYLSKAMRLQATPTTRRLLAAAQLRQHRPAKALETLQPLLQDAGAKDPGLSMLAGEAYLASGDLRRAAEYFDAAKASPGSEALARTRLGQLALRQGDIDRGEQELVAASALGSQATEPDLMLASLHLRRGEPDKALAAAQAFIKKQPQNPLGHVLEGSALVMQGNPAGARQSFEAALKLKPDDAPALRALTDLDVAEGRAADALKRYEMLLGNKPDDEQLLVAMAGLQERMGRVDDAAKALRKAIAANPRAQAPVVALVQYHLRRKELAMALELVQDAVRNNPDELSLGVLLAEVQEAAGANKEALRTLNALVLKEPNAAAPLVRLAQMQARQRDLDGAAATLLRARAKAPNDEGVARILVAVYLQAGKVDDALKVARDVQARKPEAAAGHLLEGDVRTFAKKWPEAERAYRTALKVEPGSTDAAAKVYGALHAAGQVKDADAFATQWLAGHPNDVGVRLLVADRALRSRNYPAAIQQYEQALRVNPNQPLVLNNLAWALGQTKDPKAIGTAERAVAMAPNNPDVLDTLGMLLLEFGDAKKGLELVQRARALAPDRLDLRLHHAKALLKNGLTAEGKAELRELAAVKADYPGKSEIPALMAAQ